MCECHHMYLDEALLSLKKIFLNIVFREILGSQPNTTYRLLHYQHAPSPRVLPVL